MRDGFKFKMVSVIKNGNLLILHSVTFFILRFKPWARVNPEFPPL